MELLANTGHAQLSWSGKNVLVIGAGETGMAAAGRLNQDGAVVTVFDQATDARVSKRAEYLRQQGIAVNLGCDDIDVTGAELVIVSPGVRDSKPFLSKARHRMIPVWSEVELAYRLTDKRIIAITGTNGKTTVTRMVGEMFRRADRDVVVAGNIGFPLVKALDRGGPDATLVAEVSSFQLMNTDRFRPFIGALLNVTPDHLDWHGDFEDYVSAKLKLFRNQEKSDFAVLNRTDPQAERFASVCRARVVYFDRNELVEEGIGLKDGKVIHRGARETIICDLDKVGLAGPHNVDNILAASAVAVLAELPAEAIRDALYAFKGLPHRLELVTEVGGVRFYNDSKATNPDAAMKALEAFSTSVVWIGGGRSKGNDLRPLAKAAREKAKEIVLFGESASELAGLLEGDLAVHEVSSLEEAVEAAAAVAVPGDTVLLSPGCASFDQFTGYVERGAAFKKAVSGLAGRGDVR